MLRSVTVYRVNVHRVKSESLPRRRVYVTFHQNKSFVSATTRITQPDAWVAAMYRREI